MNDSFQNLAVKYQDSLIPQSESWRPSSNTESEANLFLLVTRHLRQQEARQLTIYLQQPMAKHRRVITHQSPQKKNQELTMRRMLNSLMVESKVSVWRTETEFPKNWSRQRPNLWQTKFWHEGQTVSGRHFIHMFSQHGENNLISGAEGRLSTSYYSCCLRASWDQIWTLISCSTLASMELAVGNRMYRESLTKLLLQLPLLQRK